MNKEQKELQELEEKRELDELLSQGMDIKKALSTLALNKHNRREKLKEQRNKLYSFITLINDFICTLLPHDHLEEDYEYGITILSDIEQAQRQIETRFDKHWDWDKLAFENLWNKEQIDLMKKIIEGLKGIKEDTILGIDIDTIIKSDYAFEDFTKESIQNMHKNGDDWGIITDTETGEIKERTFPDDSHNYFVTTQSILSTLLNRCSFLNTILYNPIISTLELYDNVYNINYYTFGIIKPYSRENRIIRKHC